MDKEIQDRLAAVDRAVEGKVKRGFMTSSELDALPGLLEDDEQLLTVSRADVGWRAGLLAVTDRRVLFLYLEEVRLECPRESVRSATKETSTWSGNKLVLETADGDRTFTNVPDETLDELLEAVRPASRTSAESG